MLRLTCCRASLIAFLATLASLWSVLAAAPGYAADSPTGGSIYAKENLAAWCIVPFDASRRGPVERAQMLNRLGLTKLAYDWRDEHIPTFETEILTLREHGIEFFAFWSPASQNPGYQAMMKLLEQHAIHPRIWMIAPNAEAGSQEERVKVNAEAMLPFVRDAKRLGCRFALYNHGGWSGEPDNLIAMVRWLRENVPVDDVGIVYNFHHGHEHLPRFPAAFQRMVPYLTCVNLNGMTVGGAKILPVGEGKEDRRMLEMIRDSGYSGPIGVLDHRGEIDAEKSLRENLSGMKRLLGEMGDTDAANSYGP
ncbi:MAG: TIM barrel protein [Planctomycetes bacterium]|nr:TIM barrel protein [Planctomycetota bacterium]